MTKYAMRERKETRNMNYQNEEERRGEEDERKEEYEHGSFGHRIKISDGEHRPDSAQCVLPCPLNAKKIMNKSS